MGNLNGQPFITVCGRPHGVARRNSALLGGIVRVEIVASTSKQFEIWLNQIRARIMPWKLLQQEVEDAVTRGASFRVDQIENVLRGFVTSSAGTEPHSFWTDEVQMEKLPIADELIAHGTAAVEKCAALSKLVAERVAETAEVVADVAKCVAGASTIFHLVALGAQAVSMCAEASRGRKVLLVLPRQVIFLLRYTLESMTEIMKTSRSVTRTDTDFVFAVFKHAVGAMDLAETQLLRGRGSQIINAGNVKEVERKLEDLIHRVVTAGTISKISMMAEIVKQFKDELEIWEVGVQHERPSPSAFFSGRTLELNRLRGILEKWGSAVVARDGRVGKTELIITFAEQAEQDEQEPREVFWVTLKSGKARAIESLAGLGEKLIRKKMIEKERRNPSLVVAALKRRLSERKGGGYCAWIM